MAQQQLHVLCLAALAGLIAACAELPYHAAITQPGPCPEWRCLSGFFRTAPTNPSLATCKPCTQPACPAGSEPSVCLPTADSACVQCARQPPANAHFADPSEGCAGAVICDDGFSTAASAESCTPCAIGMYCAQGHVDACGPNATTAAVGATTVLECLPLSPAQNGVGLVAGIDIALTAPMGTQLACPRLQSALSWLQYGMLLGCKVSTRDASGLQGTVLCSVITSEAAAQGGVYVAWLTERLHAKASSTANALAACLADTGLTIVEQSITTQPAEQMMREYYGFIDQTGGATRLPPPLDPPPLRFEPIPWGQQPQDAVALLAALGILGTTLPLSLCMILAGICSRRGHLQALQQLLHDVHHQREAQLLRVRRTPARGAA